MQRFETMGAAMKEVALISEWGGGSIWGVLGPTQKKENASDDWNCK